MFYSRDFKERFEENKRGRARWLIVLI
jgi:hypothetical protein